MAGAGHLRLSIFSKLSSLYSSNIAKMSATSIETYKMWVEGKEIVGDAEQSVRG
jgi:hypothetical protein